MPAGSPTARADPATAAGPLISLTVGTAGHIDHGKTALVTFLTGCNTDRLPEEQARGMTIDLGFAVCTLPDNRRIGIVDVPGHERFIHNMVAGATGIDVVMLVVAADDGVMPQTTEHFHILRLLGVKSGLVALTKIDLVPPDRIEEVTGQIRALVSGSFLDGCPIAPVSAKTGEGFDGFYTAFTNTVDRTARRDASGVFRLHVERAFVLQGIGTIVSGIARSGAVRVGDEVEMLPSAERFRVRGVQVYGQDTEVGRAGECIALKLGGMTREKAGRGAVLATPGYFRPARFLNAHFHFLPEFARTLKPRTAIRAHLGTAEAKGYLALPTLDPLRAGMDSFVQIQLDAAVTAAPGDFFVARSLSPVATLGGGRIVAVGDARMRRSRGDWTEQAGRQEQAAADPRAALRQFFAAPHARVSRLADIAHAVLLREEETKTILGDMASAGEVVALPGERYVAAPRFAAARTGLLEAVGRLHDARPLGLGFAKKEIFRELAVDPLIAEHALAELAQSGALARNPCGYYIPHREARLRPAQAALADAILKTYAGAAFASPRRDELPARVGAPAPVVDPIVDFLVQRGELVAICEKVLLHREALERSRELLVGHLARHGAIEAAQFKDLLGTTRKYAIPLLEYWDAQGLTRREGDRRRLRE